MRTRNNHKARRKPRTPLLVSLRTAFSGHLRQYRLYYVPLLAPMALFFLAHLATLLAWVLIKSRILPLDQQFLKTMVIWAVFGFLPLLICSYVGFFVVARPSINLLARTLADQSATIVHLAVGGVYGLAVGLALIVLVVPDTWLKGSMILLIGLLAGQGNWFFYRKWTPADA